MASRILVTHDPAPAYPHSSQHPRRGADCPGLNGRERGAGGGLGRGARGWRLASALSLACARRRRATRRRGPKSREAKQRHLPAEVRGAAPSRQSGHQGTQAAAIRLCPLIPQAQRLLPSPATPDAPAGVRGRRVAAPGRLYGRPRRSLRRCGRGAAVRTARPAWQVQPEWPSSTSLGSGILIHCWNLLSRQSRVDSVSPLTALGNLVQGH